MENIRVTAATRGSLSAVSMGQGLSVPTKWQLLAVVEDIRECLGLRGTSITVLRAMLSFLQTDRVNAERDADHVCFASNATLARRAHVSVQTVERHIAKLAGLGLIARQTSGNGKRWARRDGAGQVTVVSGLSLLPLLHRFTEFTRRAQAEAARRTKISDLRAKCTLALARLAERAEGTGMALVITEARKALRRRLDADALDLLLIEIKEQLSDSASVKTPKIRDSGPEIEGHKEPALNPDKKDMDFKVQVRPDQMEASFPRLCSDLRTLGTQRACARRMDELADGLNLGPVWLEAKKLGPALSFILLGYALERCDGLRSPRAYLSKLIAGLRGGEVQWSTLLGRPKAHALAVP